MDKLTMKLYGLLVILDHASAINQAAPIGDFDEAVKTLLREFEATKFANLPAHDCLSENKLEAIASIPLVDNGTLAGTKILRMCSVCGRRHWELDVVPVEIKVAGAPIG